MQNNNTGTMAGSQPRKDASLAEQYRARTGKEWVSSRRPADDPASAAAPCVSQTGHSFETEISADSGEIRRFVHSLFKRCVDGNGRPIGGRIALRAFTNEKGNAPVLTTWEPLSGSPVMRATEAATLVARRPQDQAAVFAPPVCIFNEDGRAREADVLAAPAIVADLDADPTQGLAALRAVLGPPTVVVASGGVWVGPDSTKHDKLHVYWRLARPAVSAEEKALLRSVRSKIAKICGGDPSASALSHPMRWPGSWHTKGEPRLCAIRACDDDREIDLREAAALVDAKAGADPTPQSGDADGRTFRTAKPWSRNQLMDVADRLPNPDLDWDTWNTIGLAFFDASHGSEDGAEAFAIFSDKSSKHDEEGVYDRWAHYKKSPPDRISGAWLIDRVREKGDDPCYCLPSRDTLTDAERDRVNDLFLLPTATDSAPARKRFNLRTLDAIEQTAFDEPDAPLIEGLLDQGALSILFGASNVGKSFVALDAALAITQGRPWAGQVTTKMGVLYLATEGGRKIGQRALALRKAYGRGADDASFVILSDSVDLFSPAGDLSELIAAANSIEGLGVIIIDTLARVFGSGDESGTKDMNAFIRNIDRLRAATKAHVMLVHHTGKDESRGARGSSVLRAAVDTEIEVTRSGDDGGPGGTIRTTKQRDLDGNFSRSFVLEKCELADERTGRVVASCIARVSAEVANKVLSLSASQREVLQALTVMGNRGEAHTLKAVAEEMGGARSENAVLQLLKKLEAKSFVSKQNGRWRLRTNRPGTSPIDWFQNLDEGPVSGGGAHSNQHESN